MSESTRGLEQIKEIYDNEEMTKTEYANTIVGYITTSVPMCSGDLSYLIYRGLRARVDELLHKNPGATPDFFFKNITPQEQKLHSYRGKLQRLGMSQKNVLSMNMSQLEEILRVFVPYEIICKGDTIQDTLNMLEPEED